MVVVSLRFRFARSLFLVVLFEGLEREPPLHGEPRLDQLLIVRGHVLLLSPRVVIRNAEMMKTTYKKCGNKIKRDIRSPLTHILKKTETGYNTITDSDEMYKELLEESKKVMSE